MENKHFINTCMNHHKYLDTLLENTNAPQWATIKNIPDKTEAKWEFLNSSGKIVDTGKFKFTSSEAIGKRYKFTKSDDYTELWYSTDLRKHLHKDWLEFEDKPEGTAISLFPRD